MSKYTFAIGGPFYKGLIDIRTMSSIMQLVGIGPSLGWECKRFIGQDALLDIARNKLMDSAMETGAQWFVSIDADVSINPAQVENLFASLEQHDKQGIAIVGFPTVNAHGGWNVVADGKVQRSVSALTGDELQHAQEVDCIGTGLIAFRLGWYAKHWPENIPYFQTVIVPAAPPGASKRTSWGVIGEDYGHCNAVKKLGGTIIADWRLRGRHHMSRPGSPASKAE